MRRFGAALLIAYTVFSGAWLASGLFALRLSPWSMGAVALDYVFSALNLALGLFLAVRRPRDATAQLMAAGMIGTAAAFNLQSHIAMDIPGTALRSLHILLHHTVAGVCYVFALALFPSGRLDGPRARTWAAAAILAMLAASRAATAAGTTGFVLLFGVLIPAVGLVAQAHRYRAASAPEDRQRARLVAWALVPSLVAGVALASAVVLMDRGVLPWHLEQHALKGVVFRSLAPPFALIPLVLFVGIVRYRLWDIEVVVRRSFLYGAMAGFLTLGYVGTVAGAGAVLGMRSGPAVSLTAALIVALVFQPARARLSRLADRVVYGRRATPYEVMAGFTRELSGSLSIDEVLPRVAEAAARGVGAAYSRATVFLSRGLPVVKAWPDGDAVDGPVDLTVTVDDEGTIGEIAVRKQRGDDVTGSDRRLLSDLAERAALMVRNVRLTEELRSHVERTSAQSADLAAARRRLFVARDAEHERFEREIREGVERHLLAVDEMLSRSAALLPSEPRAAVALLDVVGGQAETALDSLRDVARESYPPLLADRGLPAALEAYLRKHGPPADLDLNGAEGVRLDRPVEAATYFCCVQALRNVAAYASGSRARVALRRTGGAFEVSVSDHGPGFDPRLAFTGRDLQVVRDRIEAVGGSLDVRTSPGEGTTVRALVPLPAVSPARPER